MNAKEIIIIPDETLSNKTNCGSQLVGMLEQFDAYNYYSKIDGDYGNLPSEYVDWLHEKDKEHYRDVSFVGAVVNFSKEELNNVLKIFKANQLQKGIKVYG